MAPADLFAALDANDDLFPNLAQGRGRGSEVKADALLLKHGLNLRGDVRILAVEKLVHRVYQGDLGAETAKHLAELASDIAAAQHHQMARQVAQLHDAPVVEPGNALDSANRRNRRAGADIDHHDLRSVLFAVYLDLAFPGESRRPVNELDALPTDAETLFHAFSPAADDRIFSVDDCGQIDSYTSGLHPQAFGRPRDVRRACAGDHRFGRGASRIGARPAQLRPLGDQHPFSRRGQPRRKRNAGLASSDDDHVDVHEWSPVDGRTTHGRGEHTLNPG